MGNSITATPAHSPAVLHWLGERRQVLSSLAGIVILVLALAALRGLLDEVNPRSIGRAFALIPAGSWLVALAATGASYACLTLYDFAALRTLGLHVPFRTAATAGMLSYAISNMLGLSLLTGGAVRMAVYRRAGLVEGDVLRVVALASLTFWSGWLVLFALSVALLPPDAGSMGVELPEAARLVIPPLAGTLFIALLAWLGRGGRRLARGDLALPLPGAGAAFGQVLVSAADLAACAAIVFALLPASGGETYAVVLAAYILALGVGVVAHSPGGVGVFEAVMILLLPDTGKDALVAALIGYRLVYYLLPFLVASLVILLAERRALLQRARALVPQGQSIANGTAPPVLAGLALAAGAALIWTTAVPSAPGAIARLARYIPHEFYSISHLASSAVGTVLLFVGWGLYRRLDAAWLASLLLAATGLILALFLGPDLTQAAICAGLITALLATRTAFYRQTSLMAEPMSPHWLAAVAAVLAIAVFIGFWAFKDVAYSNHLWWEVKPSGDAARFLRAALTAGLLAAALSLRWLLSPGRLKVDTSLDERVFAAALSAGGQSQAHLARTGDKAFLVAPEGDAFLMFRQSRHTLVAMGDPVGPRERWSALAWRLRDMADQQRARLAFYECSPAMLELAVDLGLGVIKLGEEARVPLAGFALEGGERAKLRHAVNRAVREGLSFRVIAGEAVAPLLPELMAISDDWLLRKGGREKQFSLGRFDPEYLCEEPMALIEKDGRIVAFANLWPMASREELSFDLMRYSIDAPAGTMDFMFVQMMLWGSREGYAWISLGVSPLSGIEGRRLAPAWARVADQLFRHGERFYGFEGLRRYKEKFAPAWTPRYLAAPRGIGTALALLDILLLVSAPRPPRPLRFGRNKAATRTIAPEAARISWSGFVALRQARQVEQ